VQIGDWRLPIADCTLQVANCRLQVSRITHHASFRCTDSLYSPACPLSSVLTFAMA
jgi:hypothetical protein